MNEEYHNVRGVRYNWAALKMEFMRGVWDTNINLIASGLEKSFFAFTLNIRESID